MNNEKMPVLTEDQYKKLYEISRRLNSAEDLSTLFSSSLHLVLEVVDAERGIFARYHPDEDRFSLVSALHIEKGKIDDLAAFSSGVLRKVIESGAPQLLHDLQTSEGLSAQSSVMLNNIKSVIGIPVVEEGSIWGVIVVDSIENRRLFTRDNLVFLDFVSNLISLTLHRLARLERLEEDNLVMKTSLAKFEGIKGIVGQSAAIQKVISQVVKVADTGATVLLLGESGTGKDLFARAIHDLSRVSAGRYVAQFCGSIPDNLLESELFGFRKGAFTGATADKKGLFEVADGGSFFLDEIADISPALQAKLLRVIQNKEIIRLGDTESKKIDVRIITATNKDLKQMIKEGTFREDLYYRLNVFAITIPPLRERKGDIPLLADHFLKKYGDGKMRFDKGALARLETYSWPGNVRQLENVIQRAAIFASGGVVTEADLDYESVDEGTGSGIDGTLNDLIRDTLLKRLDNYDGNRTLAARSLGVSVRWIQKKLKEMEENSGRMITKFGESDE